jgi:hypothetical protein
MVLKVSRYPQNADGTPMDLEVGVLVDETGNNGARLANVPIGPDNAPIDAKALVLVDPTGSLVDLVPSSMVVDKFTSLGTKTIPVVYDTIQTNSYDGVGGGAIYVFDAAVDAAYVAANPNRAAMTQNGRGFRLAYERMLFTTPEMVGAKGDGATNDHPAFRTLTAIAAQLNYMHILMRHNAVYRVGKQIPNGFDSEGLGPMYRANENPLEAIGLDSVVIAGNNATLKHNDGLLYGAFDPATNLPIDDAVSTLSHNAHPGFMLYLRDNDSVTINNLNGDGNSVNFVLGGTNGGFFEQRHTGLQADSFLRFEMRNCSWKYFYQDGYHIRHKKVIIDATADEHPAYVENVTAQDCGRTCAATLGGNMVMYKNCSFLRPGNVPAPGGGVRSTGPAAAHDVESEGSITANIHFEGCTFEQGPGQGTRAFSCGATPFNISFNKCKLVGGVLIDSPRTRFSECHLYGYFWRMRGNQASVEDNMLFEKCFITDATDGDTPLQTPSGSTLWNGQSSPQATGIIFDNCEFDMSRLVLNMADMYTFNCKATLRQNTLFIADNTAVMQLNGAGYHFNLKMIEAIASNFPATGYFVSTSTNTKYIRCEIVSATPRVKWTSNAAGHQAGPYDTVNGTQLGSVSNADANVTLYPRYSKRFQYFDNVMAGSRNVTLSTLSAVDGDEFYIKRTLNATGNFNLNIGAGPLIVLQPGQGCRVVYSAAAAGWLLADDFYKLKSLVANASGLTVSATDKLLGRATAGAGAVEEIALTAAGRALIDDADAAAQRTTLGLGVLATKGQVAAATDLASSATTGSLPAPNNTIVIANAATPTNVELLEYCVELESQIETLKANMRTAGVLL